MDARIQVLNENELQDNRYVVYWMQSSQRTEYNHALEYAIVEANKLSKPLLVCFGLTAEFPEANTRHYTFMLEGLKEVQANLVEREIQFVLRAISPEKAAIEIAQLAAVMIVDRGYLRIERDWRKEVANSIECPLIQVETNVIVPVESASPKEEYAARTIRKKIQVQLDTFTSSLEENKIQHFSLNEDLPFSTLVPIDIPILLDHLQVDGTVPAVDGFKGGTGEAKKRLADFIERKLPFFNDDRNKPGYDVVSDMSPYLHFGQISPLYIFHQLQAASPSENKESYIEELVIRRELSMNFVFYNEKYDQYVGLPDWAKETLADHESDERKFLYTLKELEKAGTHDPYWNAAQNEMVLTGKMHGYMRMYWGKKIIEWSQNSKEAFARSLYLNNKYNLDGRDPNSFTGIAWCFGKHDHGWKEREIFGKVRYMNAKGLERKFDMQKYVDKINGLL
ncbi:deoxyribodipyrimidine photo-lyase [Lacticigenium naphthae]|uniref:deoxyribodipyrimidine photo-lyase n=1 Tax=Lacticigenium naphthae TaxID=515351 RepID=UPI000401F3F5|nr:deoxyribodipyrimidine photo-lyase [Lacticigenium naphthae]